MSPCQGLRQSDAPSNFSSLSHVSPSATSFPAFQEQFFTDMTEFEERKKRTGSIIVRGRAATTEAKFSTELSVVTQQIVANLVTPTYVQCINPERSMYKVKIANVQLQDI